jgi:hypothetical protein
LGKRTIDKPGDKVTSQIPEQGKIEKIVSASFPEGPD